MAKVRVLIADDHAILRAGLRMLLNAQPDVEVVGEAANAAETERQACELRPDVLILDLTMPGGNSFQVSCQIPSRALNDLLSVSKENVACDAPGRGFL